VKEHFLMDSPLGTLTLVNTDGVLSGLYMDAHQRGPRVETLGPRARSGFETAVEQLGEYFAGQRQVFTLPLDLAAATAFDRRVLDLIAAIPYGQTRTYGELANALGQRGAARAVGHACGRNPVPLLIACHRVVRSGFALGRTRLQGGYSGGGGSVKAALLALEQGAMC